MRTTQIDPGARVASTATLGVGVRVEFGAVIEDHVEIGDGCVIDYHAVVRSHVRMGSENHVHPNAVVGGAPQDLGYDPRELSYVSLGDRNVLREGVTVSRATVPGATTRVGSDCLLMNNAHVAHDCVVGDRVIMATGATLGGHVQVGTRAVIGGGAMAHQWCRIGAYAMVAGMVAVRRDVLPYTMLAGAPLMHYRANVLGLTRAGIEGERLSTVVEAVRRIRTGEPFDDLPEIAELTYLREWLAQESKRGRYGFVKPRRRG